MPAYRFCRPDDVPDIVEALNLCAEGEVRGTEPMTVDRFRWEMKVLDVWPSSCMIAREEDRPIGILIGAKREEETLVHRLVVDPEFRRRGHASHLLTSLSQKLAVLGPSRLVAEVPEDLSGAGALFESLGYDDVSELVDWERDRSLGDEKVPEELFVPISLGDLKVTETLGRSGRAWIRQEETLRQLGEDLHGVAIVTPERVEAYALYRWAGDRSEILALGWEDEERKIPLLTLLLARVEQESDLPLRLPRLELDSGEEELPSALGFVPARRYRRFVTTAEPA